jgi:F0F1-type ATP synthase delta subunit
LATYVVNQFEAGEALSTLVEQVAAYLIATSRTREASLVARSIEDELAFRGTVVARVSSARPLDAEVKSRIQRLLNASTVHLVEEVDSRLIGGVRIEAPGKRLDGTLKRKLLALSQVKM